MLSNIRFVYRTNFRKIFGNKNQHLHWLLAVLCVSPLAFYDITIDIERKDFNVSANNTTTQIVDYGVTWNFDRAVQYGQFVTGDYWVVGPVEITNTIPESINGFDGIELNPSNPWYQPYDKRARNYGTGFLLSLPYSANAGDSLVKAISSDKSVRSGCRPCVSEFSILTVLAEAPPANALRPAYPGQDKTIFTLDDIDWSKLPSIDMGNVKLPSYSGRSAPDYTQSTSDIPTLTATAGYFSRPWVDHLSGYFGRYIHPSDRMPDYGGDMYHRIGAAILRTMGSEPQNEKLPTVQALLQYGLDMKGAMDGAGMKLGGNGGHSGGRKMVMTYTAVLLDDTDLADYVKNSDVDAFSESDHNFFSPTANNGSGMVLLGDETRALTSTHSTYWRLIETGAGFRTNKDPYGYIDGGVNAGDDYLIPINAALWKSDVVAMTLMPELKDVYNDQDLIDITYRYVNHGKWTQPDPCAPFDGNVNNRRITYGYDGNGGCILDTDPSDGIGRYPHLHGTDRDGGAYVRYRVPLADALWHKYITNEEEIIDGSDTLIDTDNDSIPDSTDNCVNVTNTNQLDTDNDGAGNACDSDDDGDGILDTAEKEGCELDSDINCGNTSTGPLIKAPYIDENGWTVITPSTDTRKVYVSSSEGDDSNDGLTESTPVRTVARAQQIARGGYPDWILFKKGDVWDADVGYTSFKMRSNNQVDIPLGRSAEEPFVITSYGIGARPRFISNSTDFQQLAGRTYAADYFVIKGLELYAAKCDPDSTEYYVVDTKCSSSFSIIDEFHYILIEDNLIRFKQLNAHGSGGTRENLKIRRNILTDPYSINSHSQCIFTGNISNLLIEENVFNHCGWIDNEAINSKYSKSKPTIFNRSMYLARGDGNTIVRGNIDANGASGGVQMRQGGYTEGNLFLRSPIAMTYGSNQNLPGEYGGVVKDNVVLDARNIDTLPRAFGLRINSYDTMSAGYTGTSHITDLEVFNNIVTHNENGAGRYNVNAIGTGGDGKITNLHIHHNVSYDWTRSDVASVTDNDYRSTQIIYGNTATGSLNVLIEDNILQQPQKGYVASYNNSSGVEFKSNKYWSASSNPPSSNYNAWLKAPTNVTLADWKTKFPNDAVQTTPVNFVDPDRTIDTYMDSIGIAGGYDEFIRRAKLQERGNWDTRFTAEAVNAYIRAGFMIDTDNDGVGDENPFYTEDTTPLDTDSDTIPDSRDNCPNISNTDQLDTDNDGKGNVCDADDDGDGILDTAEKEGCELNPDTTCGNTTPLDTDSDTIPDSRDNCPNISNTDQLDTDNDGKGNVCDADDDGDGILDVNEKANCELNTNTRCGITIGGSPRGRGVFKVRTTRPTSPKKDTNTRTQENTLTDDNNTVTQDEKQKDSVNSEKKSEKISNKAGRGNGKIERKIHHISRGVIITLSSDSRFIQNYLQNIERGDVSRYGSRVELRNTSQGVAFVVLGKDEGEIKKIQEIFSKGKEEVVVGVKEDKETEQVEVKDKEDGIELSSAPEKEDSSVLGKLDTNKQGDVNIKKPTIKKVRSYRQKVLHMRDGVMVFISSKTSSGVSGVQSMSFPSDTRYSVERKDIRSGVMLYIHPNSGEYTLEELYKLFPRGVK